MKDSESTEPLASSQRLSTQCFDADCNDIWNSQSQSERMSKEKISAYAAIVTHPTMRNAQQFSQRVIPYWIGAALTALVSIVYASMFRASEDLAFRWIHSWHGLVFIVVPLTILASVALAEFFSPLAAGSGIPQVIAALEISRKPNAFLDRLLGLRMIVVKMIGSCICVAGGGVTGREGPNLQISAGIFHQVHKYWPKANSVLGAQSMVLAGGAAGLAAAFNTPLGGVVFAIEELSKIHISHIRTAVFHAVVIAGLLVQALLGNYLYFGRTTVGAFDLWDVSLLAIATLIIGAAGGALGLATSRVLTWRSALVLRRRLVFSVGCGVCLAALIYFSGDIAIGSGREVITNLLLHPEQPAPWFLGIVRGLGNFLTYAGGVVGGIFAPALSTGAGLGSLFAQIFSISNPRLAVLVGMVAFLTGLTRTPFTSTILVFEMTDSHDVVVVLMLGAILAQGAAKLIDPLSFYEHASRALLVKAGLPPPSETRDEG